MKRAKHIHDELQELGANVLAKLPLSTPYAAPEGYFAQFQAGVQELIDLQETPDPEPALQREMPFEQPSPAYFETFSANLLNRIKEESEPEWTKSMPYRVPQGYFETFPKQVTAKARRFAVSPDSRRIPVFRAVRLAASVALILFMGLGIMKIHNREAMGGKATTLSQSDIRNYVESNLDEFDTDLILNGLAANNQNNSNVELNLTKEEIRAYLDESGWN